MTSNLQAVNRISRHLEHHLPGGAASQAETTAAITTHAASTRLPNLTRKSRPSREPFAALLHQLAAYHPMATQLRALGLPLRTARISALRQRVLQVPAPVIADTLGFHYTTTRQHMNAGATWSQYAAGDGKPL